jgi:hypothetical protein
MACEGSLGVLIQFRLAPRRISSALPVKIMDPIGSIALISIKLYFEEGGNEKGNR